jgi:hypothetical protein
MTDNDGGFGMSGSHRNFWEAKKQEVMRLQMFLEDLQKNASEMIAPQTSRERAQTKELDRLQALLCIREARDTKHEG